MRKLDWFNRNPNAKDAWLGKAGLKPGELVQVAGRVYRYSYDGKLGEHVLTPASR